MAFFKKRTTSSNAPQTVPTPNPASQDVYLPHIDGSQSDTDWLSASEARYNATMRNHAGSPETFASAGSQASENEEPGVALFYYQKAIDLLHTLYDYSQFERRKPSLADASIIEGYLRALRSVLDVHPSADVSASVREVTHRLRVISSSCERAGYASSLYRDTLLELPRIAPGVSLEGLLG